MPRPLEPSYPGLTGVSMTRMRQALERVMDRPVKLGDDGWKDGFRPHRSLPPQWYPSPGFSLPRKVQYTKPV